MPQTLISVIVPVYNAGDYLKPLVDSVLGQTYTNLELLLIDDGSTDGSADVCDAYASKDPRVRALHKSNSGQSEARNLGIEKAEGDLIAFADHDDILHPRMYEILSQAMNETGASVSACGFANIPTDQVNDIVFGDTFAQNQLVSSEEIIHRFFTPAWHIPVWNKLYRRELIGDIRFHSARLGEDNYFSYRIVKKSGATAFCETPMYFQRMHEQNFEFTGIRHMAELVQAKESILHDIQVSYPGEYRNAQRYFLHECVRIINLYTDTDDPSYALQKQQVFDMMKRNSTGLLQTGLPLGQVRRFYQYRYLSKTPPNERIVI